MMRVVVLVLFTVAFPPASWTQNRQIYLPAGTLVPVRLNEGLSSLRTSADEPVLFELARQVEPFRGVEGLPKTALILARVVRVKRAGRFWGKAQLELRFEEVLLPDGKTLPITARLIEVAGHRVDTAGTLVGRGHRKQDLLLILFPPTTVFRVLYIPARGPDINLKPEVTLTLKLLNPLIAESKAERSW